jgi:hypothetical protein
VSGQHFGHYKVIAEMATHGRTQVAETIIILIYVSIITSIPLQHWLHSRGKYRKPQNNTTMRVRFEFYIKHHLGVQTYQTSNRKWVLHKAHHALPGITCHSAIWSKVLHCDLMKQTLSTGTMTAAAFDHILHISSARGEVQGQTVVTIITNQLLTTQNNPDIKIQLVGDNLGGQQKCGASCKINQQRKTNM